MYDVPRLLQRRRLLKGVGAMAAAPWLGRPAGASGPPNIIFITADDLGWRCLGCLGDPNADTPNLDRLAERGVRFTNAFVASPSCSASRAAFITGQSPHSVGVFGLTHLHPEFQMAPDHWTLPRQLAAHGWATALHGKWHVAPEKPVEDYGYQSRANSFGINNSAAATAYISQNRDRPFYLELNFIQTHRPPKTASNRHAFTPHPRHPVDPARIKLPDYWSLPDWPELREDAAGYYSRASRMDEIIGEVLDHLGREGLARRTMVVFVSDNGPPYPGCKMTCYDRGIGVPLIMSWPEGLPEGGRVEGLAGGIDLAPTCLEAVGLAIPPVIQGTSLLPMARGHAREVHSEVFAEMTFHDAYVPIRAVRTRDWKYIENLTPNPIGLDQNEEMDWSRKLAEFPGQKCCVPRPPEELYRLGDDPNEQNNLADRPEFTEIKRDLKRRLGDWRRRTRDPWPDLHVPDP